MQVHKMSKLDSFKELQGCSWYKDRGGKTKLSSKPCPFSGCSTMVKCLSDHLRRAHKTTLTKLKLAGQMQESIKTKQVRKELRGNSHEALFPGALPLLEKNES